jgi:hypothetical protein
VLTTLFCDIFFHEVDIWDDLKDGLVGGRFKEQRTDMMSNLVWLDA